MSGVAKRYDGYCATAGPAAEGEAKCGRWMGPEWEYDSYGNTGECQFNCVDFGPFGTACTDGTRVICKHTKYLGDTAACCTTGSSGNSQLTCNPGLTLGSGKCDTAMKQYCAGDKITKDPRCVDWGNQRPEAARQMMAAYCAANMADPLCKTWCHSEGNAGRATCDAAVISYCSVKTADPYCACVASKLQTKLGINPKCNDAACIRNNGYLTQSMRSSNCPDITNCEMNLKLQNSGVMLTAFNINQECGRKEAPAPAPTYTPPAPTQPPAPYDLPPEFQQALPQSAQQSAAPARASYSRQMILLFVILFVLLIGVLVILIVVAVKRRK